NRESTRRNVPVETTNSSALVSCDGLRGYDWSDQAKEGPNYVLMAYSTLSSDYEFELHCNEITIRELRKKLETIQREKDFIQLTVEKLENASKSLNKLIDSQIVDNCKKGLGYNEVLPPHTGLFMQPKLDFSYIGLKEFTSEPTVETLNAKTTEEVPKVVKKDNVSLIIEDWKSADEDESLPQTKIQKKTVKSSVAKDETSGILKSFITRIENLVDHKVKVIRCDNGNEFKNRDMNQFYEMKGIMRPYSVARTPQQNGVAKRRNKTLIEAARTMLADSKLPTTFWAEAVNIGCYVQNKVNKVSRQENKCKDQEEKDSVNSTNRVNAVSLTVNAASNEVNVVGRKSSIELPDDPNMTELEDISTFKDLNKDVFGLEADLNNLKSTF
nr:putative ribonuclease H-like domain-containing protein [Tanacetum cinerariifolium]